MMTDQEIACHAIDRLLSIGETYWSHRPPAGLVFRLTAESLESRVLEIITEAVAQGRHEGECDGIRGATDAVTVLLNGMLTLPFPPAKEEEE